MQQANGYQEKEVIAGDTRTGGRTGRENMVNDNTLADPRKLSGSDGKCVAEKKLVEQVFSELARWGLMMQLVRQVLEMYHSHV